MAEPPTQPPEENTNPKAAAPEGKPAHKPDDHLTDDSPIAPPDAFESPREEPITEIDPHAGLPEDDVAFNEFRTPGESLDLHHAHALPATHGPRASSAAATRLATAAPGGVERFRPVPVWLVAGSALLLIWAGIYLGQYSGGFQGDVFNEEANYHPTSGPPVDPNSPDAMAAQGAKVFTVNCAQCHQQSGLGQAGQYPPLVGSEWVVGDAPNRLPQILLHGIQGVIHVKGAVYNNQMPPWMGTLSDKQIAQVLTYVRGKLGGNSAGPVTEKEVADAHKLTASRSDSWTEAELLAMPPAPLEGPGGAPATAAPSPGAAQAPGTANPPAAGPTGRPASSGLGQGPVSSPSPAP